jgi:uncharacterized Fe-S radical SAM superfamily protein PflX
MPLMVLNLKMHLAKDFDHFNEELVLAIDESLFYTIHFSKAFGQNKTIAETSKSYEERPGYIVVYQTITR